MTPGLQHARLSCPSLSLRVCSDSCPLSRWCHPTILSSVASFSSYLQSFPALRSFPISWVFASSGQSIGASASVLPMNIQEPKSLINNFTYTFFSWLIKWMILGPFYRWEHWEQRSKMTCSRKGRDRARIQVPSSLLSTTLHLTKHQQRWVSVLLATWWLCIHEAHMSGMCVYAQPLSCVQLWTVTHQALLLLGLSQQEYWSGLPSPPPGDLPEPGIEPESLASAGRFFITELPEKPVMDVPPGH